MWGNTYANSLRKVERNKDILTSQKDHKCRLKEAQVRMK